MDRSFISSEIPPDIHSLILDCFYVSNLPTGCKLSISTRNYSHVNIMDSLTRRWSGESRYKSVGWINSLIDRGLTLSAQHEKWIPQITSALSGLKKSIVGLKSTYHNDPNIVSELTMIEKKIDLSTLERTFADRKTLVKVKSN